MDIFKTEKGALLDLHGISIREPRFGCLKHIFKHLIIIFHKYFWNSLCFRDVKVKTSFLIKDGECAQKEHKAISNRCNANAAIHLVGREIALSNMNYSVELLKMKVFQSEILWSEKEFYMLLVFCISLIEWKKVLLSGVCYSLDVLLFCIKSVIIRSSIYKKGDRYEKSIYSFTRLDCTVFLFCYSRIR